MKTVAVLFTMLIPVLAHAETVAHKKARVAIDETVAKAAADIKDCGKKFTAKFDWKAYDAIDWKTVGRDKYENLPNEHSSLVELGQGLDRLCADKDYKAAFIKVRTIIYKPTNDDSITVRAVISGSTMTLENYSFGSTRHADDYEAAAKAAL